MLDTPFPFNALLSERECVCVMGLGRDSIPAVTRGDQNPIGRSEAEKKRATQVDELLEDTSPVLLQYVTVYVF
jgi:hypothetical protein